MPYKYRLSNTHANSDRYGACEVCGKWAPEVWSWSELKQYIPDAKTLAALKEIHGPNYGENAQDHFTYADCQRSYFGHLKCVVGMMRRPIHSVEVLLRSRDVKKPGWVSVVEYLEATGVDLRPILGDSVSERCGRVGDS